MILGKVNVIDKMSTHTVSHRWKKTIFLLAFVLVDTALRLSTENKERERGRGK